MSRQPPPATPEARPKPRAATVHDVARTAGVSAQTVSRLLKGYQGIRPTTRLKVEAAIKELGYRPNLAARLLRTQKSMRIGAIVHEMFEYGPALLLRGANARAREAGYSMNIIGVDSDDEGSVRNAFDTFDEERVAGILAVTLTDGVRRVVENHAVSIPVLIDPSETPRHGPTHNELGATLVAEHFAHLGHRRFGVVEGLESWLPARQRRDAFITAAEALGAVCVRRWAGDWTAPTAYQAALTFDPADDITAVFAVSDATAIGFVRGLASRGIDVPGDLSVAGFDAIPLGDYMVPALTTVQAEFEQQGRDAMSTLLNEVLHGDEDPVASPGVSLVVRSSTAPPRRVRADPRPEPDQQPDPVATHLDPIPTEFRR